jgi:hypothetical protein
LRNVVQEWTQVAVVKEKVDAPVSPLLRDMGIRISRAMDLNRWPILAAPFAARVGISIAAGKLTAHIAVEERPFRTA